MTDIVEQLRNAAHNTSINTGFWHAQNATLFAEAAAEIERLRSSISALNARIIDQCVCKIDDNDEIMPCALHRAWRDAAVLAEREACARTADPMPESAHSTPYEKQAIDIRTNIAAAIRARTEGE